MPDRRDRDAERAAAVQVRVRGQQEKDSSGRGGPEDEPAIASKSKEKPRPSLLPRDYCLGRGWFRRLDRVVADLNAILLVLAIGLATLDLTFFVAYGTIDHWSQITSAINVQELPVAQGATANQLRLP